MSRGKVINNKGMSNGKSIWSVLSQQKWLIIMSVPMLFYVLLFNYAPMWGWITAFQKYDVTQGLIDSEWIGIDHFKWLFKQEEFWQSVRNTLGMSVINLVFGTVSAILLAVLLNEVRNKTFKRTVQTVTYLPHFLSMIIVVNMSMTIFDTDGRGLINNALTGLGLIKTDIRFLGEPKYFWWLQGIINVWKEVGWSTIIYITAMTSIDPCLYEAASIDGAGRFKRIWHVTLPGIRSTFVILLIMNIGHLMEAGFEIPYLLGNSLTVSTSRNLDVYVLERSMGLLEPNLGRGTAIGMFKSVVAIILLFSANFISSRLGEDSLI